MAYREMQAGLPIGHLVGLDACASGPSIMSTLVGCKVGAKNTGLIGTIRMDLYAEATKVINGILSSNFPDNVMKDALMP